MTTADGARLSRRQVLGGLGAGGALLAVGGLAACTRNPTATTGSGSTTNGAAPSSELTQPVELTSQATGATLYLNPADTFDFAYTPLHDGDHYELPGGVAMSVAAMNTPGHTMGSTMYFVGDDVVLTGDPLFVEGVGRPDLADRAEEFAHNLYHSLRERVLTLPEPGRPHHCPVP